MRPDELQKAWQSAENAPHAAADLDTLVASAIRKHREFRGVILRRDVREVGVCLLMAAVFIMLGDSWPWDVLAVLMLYVGAFLVIDRIRQAPRNSQFGDSLIEGMERSVREVNHQIWLLKNVFWWYLHVVELR